MKFDLFTAVFHAHLANFNHNNSKPVV